MELEEVATKLSLRHGKRESGVFEDVHHPRSALRTTTKVCWRVRPSPILRRSLIASLELSSDVASVGPIRPSQSGGYVFSIKFNAMQSPGEEGSVALVFASTHTLVKLLPQGIMVSPEP